MLPLNYHQFILYKLVPKDNGKTDKIPLSPVSFNAVSPLDPLHWVDFDTASAIADMSGPDIGVAFVFTKNDPFFFLDIDNCNENGQWSALATDLINRLPGAYIEVSSSGNGLHLFGQHQGELLHSCKNTGLGLELYTESRFVALTGTGAMGNWYTDLTADIRQVVQEYFQPMVVTVTGGDEWNMEPVEDWAGIEDDEQLIRIACKSSSAASTFGGRATFRDLYEGNTDRIAATYPPQNAKDPYDRSSADMALASHLAFWTGKHHERIKRLMEASQLVRPKWTRHRTYLRDTIVNACRQQTTVFKSDHRGADEQRSNDNPELEIIPSLVPAPSIKTGDQFMPVTQQLEYFQNCVYVQDLHRILVPDGGMLKPDQFKATYGGYKFSMDYLNEKTTTNAWELFTESQAVKWTKVNSSCFRPELPSHTIIEEEGKSMVNTYVPIETEAVKGDVTPFLNHLEKLFPVERDRKILLSYMAACVQYPGTKFQWCPILQGTEGNGKTVLITTVSRAVGVRYTHLPNASDIASKFNAWIHNKLFIGIEEIYVAEKREMTEALKPLITNKRIEIQGKGRDQVTGDNRANFIMCTNHKDAMPVTVDGRRYAIFYSAQQSKDDKLKYEMTPEYFMNLYNWLESGGYAHTTHFLKTMRISAEFNPAKLCNEAPRTSSTKEALMLSMGGLEQEIMEAVEEGRPGFANGWVSSIALDRLITRLRLDRAISVRRRRAIMNSLGYDWHPALPNGRVNNPITAEGGKPKLFIKDGHVGRNIETGAEVVAAYCKAQGFPPGFGQQEALVK